ncbi:MAG: hypothetical protein NT169_28695 [Chloroflexi bacterium]|nr:hypothetical protein [Chloroflexota bacterium]
MISVTPAAIAHKNEPRIGADERGSFFSLYPRSSMCIRGSLASLPKNLKE